MLATLNSQAKNLELSCYRNAQTGLLRSTACDTKPSNPNTLCAELSGKPLNSRARISGPQACTIYHIMLHLIMVCTASDPQTLNAIVLSKGLEFMHLSIESSGSLTDPAVCGVCLCSRRTMLSPQPPHPVSTADTRHRANMNTNPKTSGCQTKRNGTNMHLGKAATTEMCTRRSGWKQNPRRKP